MTKGGDTVTLGLSEPQAYTHTGATVSVDVESVEVLKQNRNVKVRGATIKQNDGSHEDALFGTHLMFKNPESVQLRYAEFENMGQAFQMGRYSIHWHKSGLQLLSGATGCSVHRAHNRAFAIHGTNGVALKGNVATDVRGHAFFLEDGGETGNVFEGNVVSGAQASMSLLATDVEAAGFWITNPGNTLKENVASASDSSGLAS